jgi:hypothetical protein
MTYPTEELVRRIVGRFLRSDYRGEFFCSSCLVKLARESLNTTYPRSEAERAMDTVFRSPGVLGSVPTFLCAGRRKTMPCLGAPSPCLRPIYRRVESRRGHPGLCGLSESRGS